MGFTQVSTDGIKDDGITAGKIPANAVAASELADNAVDTNAIQNSAITTAKIADTSITAGKIASNAIYDSAIQNGAVTRSKIADNAVNSEHYADDSIDSAHYIDGSIDTAHIADAQITTAKIADDAVTQAKMADNAIGTSQLANNAVYTAAIQDNGVNTQKIANNAIVTSKINNSAVTDEKIHQMSASKLTGALPAIDGSNLTGIQGIPSGVIMMWSGAENAIPSGFVLCNGSNSTPDLRNKFIVGAGTGGSYGVGNTGGADSVTLSINEMPSHTHSIETKTSHGSGSFTRIGGARSTGNVFTSAAGGVANTGGGAAHENRPPFYALCYIMKT